MGVDHVSGRAERIRRVKPPPGMNGMGAEEPSKPTSGLWSTGDVYTGIDSEVRFSNEEDLEA